jgi:hypothetical protein
VRARRGAHQPTPTAEFDRFPEIVSFADPAVNNRITDPTSVTS